MNNHNEEYITSRTEEGLLVILRSVASKTAEALEYRSHSSESGWGKSNSDAVGILHNSIGGTYRIKNPTHIAPKRTPKVGEVWTWGESYIWTVLVLCTDDPDYVGAWGFDIKGFRELSLEHFHEFTGKTFDLSTVGVAKS
jgi:hypothetical protein